MPRLPAKKPPVSARRSPPIWTALPPTSTDPPMPSPRRRPCACWSAVSCWQAASTLLPRPTWCSQPGQTAGLNMVIKGLLRPGDRVVVSSMEHNAVMRPLNQLQRLAGIKIDRVPCAPDGTLDPRAILPYLHEGHPPCRLYARLERLRHDVARAGNWRAAVRTRHPVRAGRGTDGRPRADRLRRACISARWPCRGTRGFWALPVSPRCCWIRISANGWNRFLCGGTGSASDSEEQPSYMPDRFESGTLTCRASSACTRRFRS